MKNTWIHDLETYPNCFIAVFYNKDTLEWKIFEISDRKNEINELRLFLNSPGLQLIGFNNINFDYPVLHNTILSNSKTIWTSYNIYKEVVKVIENKYSTIWDNQIKIPQLDLYRIWHYDNKNKSTSLKWLEFAMRSHDVRDLPFKVGSELADDEKDELLSYCKHDVLETYKFFNKSLKHIELRQFYTRHEGLSLMNASEIKMSKEIFSKYLAKEMNMSVYDVKQLRTYRKHVDIKDIIFNYIKFNDPVNQEILTKFNSYRWRDTSNMSKEKAKQYAISFSRPYKNVLREYAEGGLHSFGKPGIYESNDEYMLVDVDFKRSPLKKIA